MNEVIVCMFAPLSSELESVSVWQLQNMLFFASCSLPLALTSLRLLLIPADEHGRPFSHPQPIFEHGQEELASINLL